MNSNTEKDNSQRMAPNASKISGEENNFGKESGDEILVWSKQFELPIGHRHVDIDRNVGRKPDRFIKFAKKCIKDGYHAVTESQGRFYKCHAVKSADGVPKIHVKVIPDEDWNIPDSNPKRMTLENSADIWKSKSSEDGASAWANEVENAQLRKGLGSGRSFSGFGDGAKLPVDEKKILEELEKKDQEEGQPGKPKYADILNEVDVVKLCITHLQYRSGENFPRPPAWREYRQLLFEVMGFDPDEIETFSASRYGQAPGSWFCCVRLKRNYDLKKTYESVKGKFLFGSTVKDGKTTFHPRWEAKIEGFNPEDNIEKKKFKLRLSKEIGVKPHMVLAAARKVMKVVGRGILKERYDAATGLVDKKGNGLGTGVYYFYAQKEDHTNWPTSLTVNGYQIRLWSPERDLEYEKFLEENPNARSRGDFESTRYERKQKANAEDLDKPRVVPTIKDFTPNFRNIILEQERLEREKRLRDEKLKAGMDANKLADADENGANVDETHKEIPTNNDPDDVTDGVNTVEDGKYDLTMEGFDNADPFDFDVYKKSSTPIQPPKPKEKDEALPIIPEGNLVNLVTEQIGEDDKKSKAESESDESGEDDEDETTKTKRSRSAASLDGPLSTEKNAKKAAKDGDDQVAGDTTMNSENSTVNDSGSFDGKSLKEKTRYNEIMDGSKTEDDPIHTSNLDRFKILINMKSPSMSVEEIKELLEIAAWKTSSGKPINAKSRDNLVKYMNEVKENKEAIIARLENENSKDADSAKPGFFSGLWGSS